MDGPTYLAVHLAYLAFVDSLSFRCCSLIMFGLGGLCEVDLQNLATMSNYVSCHASEIYMLIMILDISFVDARKNDFATNNTLHVEGLNLKC